MFNTNNYSFNANKQAGTVMVFTLLLMTLLTIFAVGLSQTTRTNLIMAANYKNELVENKLAEAGIWLTIQELIKPEEEIRLDPGDRVNKLEFKNRVLYITIMPETGKVDINSAKRPLLTTLIKSNTDLEDIHINKLVSAIIDWRDRNTKPEELGAEDPAYVEAGLNYDAKDGPFNSIEELQYVIGMNKNLYNKLKNLITVHSNYSSVNPEFAKKSILNSLPGANDSFVEEYSNNRPQNFIEDEIPVSLNPEYMTNRIGHIFTITSTLAESNQNASISAKVMINRKSKLPYSIISWDS